MIWSSRRGLIVDARVVFTLFVFSLLEMDLTFSEMDDLEVGTYYWGENPIYFATELGHPYF